MTISEFVFHTGRQEHLALAKHLTAEAKVEEFIAGKGMVTRWERVRRQNHWLDALYNACAAGYACGARLVDEQVPPRPPPPVAPLCRDNDDGYNEWTGMSREDRRHWIDSYKKW